ncbi:HEPN domain-containing protein [Zunongwangia atlantica]|uniref:Nucleotidyltransferase substrate binding subunit n=1 Tax=Zunongwangia atlantica 22II14-10F7 TaxID=1185767 RepID=A0A1Y1SXZ1_9FLAO|nr:hypothetical protein [Zunongwangia atlantica]ORL43620.1 nucleotidyltransferase substrate binding subunit [Zunongwangia atlantica 22II14-10F7]
MRTFKNTPLALKNKIEEIKNRFLSVAEMISIYFSQVSINDTEVYFLNAIYDEKVLFKEEQFIAIKEIQNEYTEFNIQIFKERQLKDIVVNFNSYALLHIYFGKVIYGSPPIPDILNNINPAHFLSVSKANFRKEQLKIIDFIGDAKFTYKGKINAYTSFGLHQSIELSFRILEQFFCGKALISHSLKAHIEYLEVRIPNIRSLFNNDQEDEKELIENLDRAYNAARYTSNFYINKLELKSTFKYFQKVFYLTQYIFDRQYENCTKIINISSSTAKVEMNHVQTINTFQRLLVDHLVTNYPVHSIYSITGAMKTDLNSNKCISWLDGQEALYKQTLLIITSEPLHKSENDLMIELDNYFRGQFKTYILLDDISNVAIKIDEGGNYLEYLLKSQNRLYALDQRLYRDESTREYFFPVEYYTKTSEWTVRKNRAEFIVSLMQDVEEKEDHATFLFLSNQLIVQVCLGLLDLFWNLKPIETDITYLVNLINHFSNHTATIFKISKFKNTGILEGIRNAPQYMLTPLPYNFDYKDMDELFSACLEFMQETNKVADKRLEDIKIMAFQRYVSIKNCFNKVNS